MVSNHKKIVGIGAPFVDHILLVTDAYIESLPGNKGGMMPVDYEALQKIIDASGSDDFLVFGGSSSNMIKGLANLGHSCALVGRVGNDLLGTQFLDSLRELKITSFLKSSSTPTAQAVCLITPDGERTMRSFFGASEEINVEDLSSSLFENAKLVHIEGYRLFNPGVVEKAMQLAKKAGAKVSFDLGSFELVNAFKDQIIYLITNYIDILFGNEEEMWSLTQLPPEKSCQVLKDLCETVVVLMGKNGCYVGQGYHLVKCCAYPIDPIDTTGAGDLFASGFLHGYLEGFSLEKSAHFGALTGAAVVNVRGVEIPPDVWAELKQQLHLEHPPRSS